MSRWTSCAARDAFGLRRLMFGSDWPVCRLAATYAEVISTARELTAALQPAERHEVFTGEPLCGPTA
ncbi:amidohydrolase family protein [Streptomyces griseus]|uniref:amidohydrolase family protein n=1 Tax=Streptomyces griseus TaxID=1911 RepID=UPI00373AF343